MSFLQKIVKNDAMKNDPPELYGWRIFFLASSACFGGTLFGQDIGAIGGILTLPAFKKTYHTANLSDTAAANLSANIVSTLQAGAFFGALFAYWASDKYGRKPSLLFAAALATVGVIMQSAGMGRLAVMYVGRLVAGLGVGSASMLTPLYVSENAPRAIRGGLTGLYQLFIALGTMISFWINYGSLLHLHGNATYIVPLACQMIPAVLLFVGICFCNESPRWLARQDNWEAAASTLSRVSNLPPDHPYIRMELHDMRVQLENEVALVGGGNFMDLQREMWSIKGNRNRVLVSIALMICQQFTGTNAINYYAPQIFKNLGIQGEEASLFATGVYGCVKVAAISCFLLLAADSLGRRRSLLLSSTGQAICLIIVGIYIKVDPPVTGAKIPPFGYFSLVCIFLFACFYQFGWGPCPWILVSELPTSRLRSMNVGVAAATQWLFNFVIARAFPNMLTSMGAHGYGTYLFFGIFCLSMGVFVFFVIPETKGLSLEKMDDLFGVTALVKGTEVDGDKDLEGGHGTGPIEDRKGGEEHIEQVGVNRGV